MKKILYFGGQKSGKSSKGEQKAIDLSNEKKPFYIATYDNSYNDSEMNERVLRHQNSRIDNFITIEQTHDLFSMIKKGETYLVDCLSMWILNNIETGEEKLLEQLDRISKIDANIVFILNEVTSGVIPFDKESRKFVDLTGIIGQKVASFCDEVYEVKFGIDKKIK